MMTGTYRFPGRRNKYSVLFTLTLNSIFILKYMAFLQTNRSCVLGILTSQTQKLKSRAILAQLCLSFDFFQYTTKEKTSGKRYLRGILRSLTVLSVQRQQGGSQVAGEEAIQSHILQQLYLVSVNLPLHMATKTGTRQSPASHWRISPM